MGRPSHRLTASQGEQAGGRPSLLFGGCAVEVVPGVSLGTQIFFLLRTALQDGPQGPPTANRQPPATASNRHQPPTANPHQPPAANRQPLK